MPIHVLFVDDHTLVRESIKLRLEKESCIEKVQETGSDNEAIRCLEENPPDVIIMDVLLKDSAIDGIDLTREIIRKYPGTKILGLSSLDDLGTVKKMLTAGASGYLLKGCSSSELVEGIKKVLNGESYFSRNVKDTLLGDFISFLQEPPVSKPEVLTKRELQVLKLIAREKTTKEIAQDLAISVKTVGTHRTKTMNKLAIFTDAGLVKYAIREGIIALNM